MLVEAGGCGGGWGREGWEGGDAGSTEKLSFRPDIEHFSFSAF